VLSAHKEKRVTAEQKMQVHSPGATSDVWARVPHHGAVSKDITASIVVLMMEAISTSATSINFHKTIKRNIPEDSYFHIHSETCFTD
jgi:hypothetical protein